MTNRNYENKTMKTENIFEGVLFIFGAVCLLLSHTDFMQGLQINVWSIIRNIILVAIIIKSIKSLDFFGIFFPISILCVIYHEPLGLTAISPMAFLGTSILLRIGCDMIFSNKEKNLNNHENLTEINSAHS